MRVPNFPGYFNEENGKYLGAGKYTWACGRVFVGNFRKVTTEDTFGELKYPQVGI